jgi:N-acyl amino acid synthase of PEP-CTERM/exosortase system
MLLGSRNSGPPGEAPLLSSLVEIYNDIFEVVPADTSDLRDECYRVWYQVYCVENAFLRAEDNRDSREIDAYDKRSMLGLLRYRKTGASVGTIRLVLPEKDGAALSLPMYRVCSAAGLPVSELLPLDGTVEISRFAISKQFRQRAGDALYGRVYQPAELAHDDRRMIPHMTLGLMGLALMLSRDRGLVHACAIMEPALIRLLARLGIRWRAVGPLIEYHGLRQPCIARIDELLANLETERPEVWEVITETSVQMLH